MDTFTDFIIGHVSPFEPISLISSCQKKYSFPWSNQYWVLIFPSGLVCQSIFGGVRRGGQTLLEQAERPVFYANAKYKVRLTLKILVRNQKQNVWQHWIPFGSQNKNNSERLPVDIFNLKKPLFSCLTVVVVFSLKLIISYKNFFCYFSSIASTKRT